MLMAAMRKAAVPKARVRMSSVDRRAGVEVVEEGFVGTARLGACFGLAGGVLGVTAEDGEWKDDMERTGSGNVHG